MFNMIGRVLLFLIGLWLVYGGGFCMLGIGYNLVFALIGLAILSLGVWMIVLACKSKTEKEEAEDEA
jgi:multisubunit Na+/H+ antiporter MnhC subunit